MKGKGRGLLMGVEGRLLGSGIGGRDRFFRGEIFLWVGREVIVGSEGRRGWGIR